MTQEEKQLLLKALCGYLLCDLYVAKENEVFRVHNIDVFSEEVNGINIEKIKPYLRPMSSMTDEEHQICNEFKHDIMTQGYGAIELYVTHYTNWLDKKHLDWRRTGNGKTLIEAGLALKAPEGMYR